MTGSSGRLPGIVEEVLLSIRARQPVYHVAGFGGATKGLFDTFNGDPPEAFSLEVQTTANPDYGMLYGDLAQTEDELTWRDTVKELKQYGIQRLSETNGLSAEENHALANATNLLEIVYLISKGLATWSKSP